MLLNRVYIFDFFLFSPILELGANSRTLPKATQITRLLKHDCAKARLKTFTRSKIKNGEAREEYLGQGGTRYFCFQMSCYTIRVYQY